MFVFVAQIISAKHVNISYYIDIYNCGININCLGHGFSLKTTTVETSLWETIGSLLNNSNQSSAELFYGFTEKKQKKLFLRESTVKKSFTYF